MALEKSKKATAITLFHGIAGNDGMNRFLKALQLTKAPITALSFADLPYVTDETLSKLPQIIRAKGILSCKISHLTISSDVKKAINDACVDNNQSFLARESSGR